MTMTYADILTEVPAHLDAQAGVPVLSGAQRQGDVGIFPTSNPGETGERIPAEGVEVVRGEAIANTHLLLSDGDAHFRRESGQVLGFLTVPQGSVAYLVHTEEHGANGIAPGTYRLMGKREQADQVRRVVD